MAEESQKEEVKFDPITRVEYTRGETNIKYVFNDNPECQRQSRATAEQTQNM